MVSQQNEFCRQSLAAEENLTKCVHEYNPAATCADNSSVDNFFLFDDVKCFTYFSTHAPSQLFGFKCAGIS